MTFNSNYEYKYWTAFREADLLKSGDHSLGKGDSFVMPGAATYTLAAWDDDSQLNGDRCAMNARTTMRRTAGITTGRHGRTLIHGSM